MTAVWAPPHGAHIPRHFRLTKGGRHLHTQKMQCPGAKGGRRSPGCQTRSGCQLAPCVQQSSAWWIDCWRKRLSRGVAAWQVGADRPSPGQLSSTPSTDACCRYQQH